MAMAMAGIPTRLHLLLLLLLLLMFVLPFLAATLGAAQSRPFGGVMLGYVRYVADASETAAAAEYDYIVVGGGAVGCLMSSMLAGPGAEAVCCCSSGMVLAEFPALATAGGFFRMLVLAYHSPESGVLVQGSAPRIASPTCAHAFSAAARPSMSGSTPACTRAGFTATERVLR